jgi:hypothetical protein
LNVEGHLPFSFVLSQKSIIEQKLLKSFFSHILFGVYTGRVGGVGSSDGGETHNDDDDGDAKIHAHTHFP